LPNSIGFFINTREAIFFAFGCFCKKVEREEGKWVRGSVVKNVPDVVVVVKEVSAVAAVVRECAQLSL
jgi:hypothetical protein